MMPERPDEERLRCLLAEHAYQEGDFVLSSGQQSNFYLDAKRVTYHPEGLSLVGSCVLDVIRRYGVDAVGGLTMGADAIVAATVLASAARGPGIPGFIARKQPKAHGLEKWIEGVPPRGARAAIVDDVVTSGGSLLQAVERARDAGAEIAVVVGLVDRQQGGREAVAAAGLPFEAICTLEEIRAARANAAPAVTPVK
jgi:orotate phosphoribosyltransferase